MHSVNKVSGMQVRLRGLRERCGVEQTDEDRVCYRTGGSICLCLVAKWKYLRLSMHRFAASDKPAIADRIETCRLQMLHHRVVTKEAEKRLPRKRSEERSSSARTSRSL